MRCTVPELSGYILKGGAEKKQKQTEMMAMLGVRNRKEAETHLSHVLQALMIETTALLHHC